MESLYIVWAIIIHRQVGLQQLWMGLFTHLLPQMVYIYMKDLILRKMVALVLLVVIALYSKQELPIGPIVTLLIPIVSRLGNLLAVVLNVAVVLTSSTQD
jgi:hypothetical protein